MLIRELATADAVRCAELEAILFPDETPWSRDVFVMEFSQPHTFYIGAFGDGGMLGYSGMAMMGPRRDPEFEIHTVGVDPEHQRGGVGRALMDQLMHTADLLAGPVFLEVRTDNAPAIALYEAYGFTIQGLRRNYYRPSGADAYTMHRPSRRENT